MRKKSSCFGRLLIMGLIILVASVFVFRYAYKNIYKSNVDLHGKKSLYIYIPTGSTVDEVYKILYKQDLIINKMSFELLARKKNYPHNVKAGKYLLHSKMSNNELINLLRSGNQTPVKLSFNDIKFPEQLASLVGKNLECDSIKFMQLFKDEVFTSKYGFSPATFFSMFMPNSYEFYWNTSAEQFIEKMSKEYKKFWTQERKTKAQQIGFSEYQTIILASIVQAEQSKFNDEKPRVAGLYINRLRVGMPLQSDPTVIYAAGIFGVKRVLKKDRDIDSPFNTYKYTGLPPAPINLPAASTIDAVLNYETNDYIFMCAKEDFSGYHNFSKNVQQHNIYAQKYQEALDRKNIMR